MRKIARDRSRTPARILGDAELRSVVGGRLARRLAATTALDGGTCLPPAAPAPVPLPYPVVG